MHCSWLTLLGRWPTYGRISQLQISLRRKGFKSHTGLPAWDPCHGRTNPNHIWKWSEVAQLCPTLCDPVDCIPPGSSIHGILQARILEWAAISFCRGSCQPRDRTQVSHIAGRRFKLWPLNPAQFAHERVGWSRKEILLLKSEHSMTQKRGNNMKGVWLRLTCW